MMKRGCSQTLQLGQKLFGMVGLIRLKERTQLDTQQFSLTSQLSSSVERVAVDAVRD